jgi:hypothetical protein
MTVTKPSGNPQPVIKLRNQSPIRVIGSPISRLLKRCYPPVIPAQKG